MAKAARSSKTPVAVKAVKAAKTTGTVVAKPAAKNAAKPAAKPGTKTAPAIKKTSSSLPKRAPATPSKPPKIKLVRDSFTMPKPDFDLIEVLKSRALEFQRPTKKSELLRAGLQALNALSAPQLQAVLGQLAPLKTGRPKKDSV